MALIVQKYGGTSMGSIERIKNVAQRVKRWHDNGHQVVVVVSAMSGETNRLSVWQEISKIQTHENTTKWFLQASKCLFHCLRWR